MLHHKADLYLIIERSRFGETHGEVYCDSVEGVGNVTIGKALSYYAEAVVLRKRIGRLLIVWLRERIRIDGRVTIVTSERRLLSRISLTQTASTSCRAFFRVVDREAGTHPL